MLKKTLIAAATLSILALGAASPASAHDRDWDGGRNWKKYSHYDDDYRYFRKPHHNEYGYWKYRPYPWWLQFYYQPRWY
ncbi:hypothetical protein [Methyloceanibacter sp.]|uniref:hypothetical protein n=1 Tax=Methyloceanibacter sp. TaxID=1965321 RepID=UPI002D2D260C|nr:hypothetical protein [Methyloceanibacter sp.]HZP09547.1 hypothetical protein [Methyloceanibacter sp.]